jgi:hypothetical protein
MEVALREATEPWLTRGLSVVAASLLGNEVPEPGKKYGPQQAHLDFMLELYRLNVECVVLIEALADYELWVWPGSHKLMREFADNLDFDYDGECFAGSVEGNEKLDAFFAKVKAEQRPVLLRAKAGQRIMIDGFFVHAGAQAWLDPAKDPAFRVHWYMVSEKERFPEDREPATYPLDNLGPSETLISRQWAKRFVEVRGRKE